jgi:hypothetical protein
MGSAGIGSVTHISGELFKMLSGVNLVHVPYRGGLLGGQVQVMFVGIPESIEYMATCVGGDRGSTLAGTAGDSDCGRIRSGL